MRKWLTSIAHQEEVDLYRDKWVSLGKSSLHIVKTDALVGSRLGGKALPSGVVPPTREGATLTLLLQLDLSEVPDLPGLPLPKKGGLYFFYNSEDQPWGFDTKDRGGWEVVYSPEPPVDTSGIPIGFEPQHSVPSYQRAEVHALGIPDAICDVLLDEFSREQPEHQLGGFPSPIQNDFMEDECYRASQGMTGIPTAEKLAKLNGSPTDGVLLAQVDSDAEANFQWGDQGILYFWIRQQDLANGNFANVWVSLQCQ